MGERERTYFCEGVERGEEVDEWGMEVFEELIKRGKRGRQKVSATDDFGGMSGGDGEDGARGGEEVDGRWGKRERT